MFGLLKFFMVRRRMAEGAKKEKSRVDVIKEAEGYRKRR